MTKQDTNIATREPLGNNWWWHQFRPGALLNF